MIYVLMLLRAAFSARPVAERKSDSDMTGMDHASW